MKGNKTYRHKQNPEEKRFHDEFIMQHGDRDMSAIVLEPNDRGTAPSRYLTPEAESIVISAMQWLGSPLGQSFLRDMGYEKKPEKLKVVMTDKHRLVVAKKSRRGQRGSVWSWKELTITSQNSKIEHHSKRIGFTLEDFYEGDLDYINKILKR